MTSFILWYLLVSALGWLAFPLAYRLLPGLPERGFAFARAIGLLMWGYLFWLLGSLGLLMNDIGGLLFAAALLAALSWWASRGLKPGEVRAWLRSERRTVIAIEAVFFAAFAVWAFVRAANPEITATEKPMEMAFINSVLRSPSMPPYDPWLSGYAISYYYFGYVMVGMLAKLTGTAAGVAFNLAISLVFALTAVGAYGLVYNLFAAYKQKTGKGLGLALFGPLFLLLVSNVEGVLEVIHARGWFWEKNAEGVWVSGFWQNTLNILELNSPPSEPFRWLPRNYGTGYWWWWRASRVLNDVNFSGGKQEVIDEFPFFSFLLADLHPHVLVMPFALLAAALALNLFLGGAKGRTRLLNWEFDVHPTTFAFGALVFGGLSFLNIWDFPLYVGLFAAAYLVMRSQAHGWGWKRLGEFLALGLALGVFGLVLYLPYYISFSSQAGGILPNLLNPSNGLQLWVMFGIFFILFLVYFAFLYRRHGRWEHLATGMLIGACIVLGLWLFSLLLTLGASRLLPELSLRFPGLLGAMDAFLNNFGAPDLNSLLQESYRRRLEAWGGWLTLAVLLGLAIGLLRAPILEKAKEETSATAPLPASHIFTLLLIFFGALLVTGPEFIYLRDQFGTRMNTIFKFYIQVWLLWSVAAGFGVAVLLSELRRVWSAAYSLLLALLLTAGLTYSMLGLWDRMDGWPPLAELNLQGPFYAQGLSPDEAAAVEWLRLAPLGTLTEAVGGSYTGYARISAASGQPALLGWPGHESQWRGGGAEMGSRAQDIELLYTTSEWEQAQAILRLYGIRYVLIGPLERSTYRVSEGKFAAYLTLVFEQGDVRIYEAPASLWLTSE